MPAHRWYDEVFIYNWDSAFPDNLNDVGHFTQLVWKATTHVGCAMHPDCDDLSKKFKGSRRPVERQQTKCIYWFQTEPRLVPRLFDPAPDCCLCYSKDQHGEVYPHSNVYVCR